MKPLILIDSETVIHLLLDIDLYIGMVSSESHFVETDPNGVHSSVFLL